MTKENDKELFGQEGLGQEKKQDLQIFEIQKENIIRVNI